MISYVARKPPFSRGRCGLAACACVRSVDIRQGARVHFASERLAVYATRMLRQINTCGEAAPYALMHADVHTQNSTRDYGRGNAVHSRMGCGSGRRTRSLL